MEYILETNIGSTDKWKHVASFKEGDVSRFGKPFSAEIAVKEAESYRDYWKLAKGSVRISIIV